MADLGVLVVEDDPVACDAHAQYVGRVPGFTVVGQARTRQAALQALSRFQSAVDLVLLDMNLPDGHGLDILRAMRAAGHRADVLAVTSARDVALIQASASLGVVSYVLKPFVFTTLRDRLVAYQDYRTTMASSPAAATQADVDRLLESRRDSPATGLPKGLSQELLDQVLEVLRETTGGHSASEVATAVGTSRVTARRYLEHLATTGLVDRGHRYARVGRPEVEYRWIEAV